MMNAQMDSVQEGSFIVAVRPAKTDAGSGADSVPGALPPSSCRSTVWCAAFLEAHLSIVFNVSASVARRCRLTCNDTEELQSRVLVKLIADDYAVIRKFEGRSRFKTYVTIVARRVALDLCASTWGRWRPTAAVRRAGPLAILLDQLMNRRGVSFDQACASIEANRGIRFPEVTRERLRQVLGTPVRRQFVGEELLRTVADPATGEQPGERAQRAAAALHAARALAAALAVLSPRERTMLTLHFRDGLTLSTISRVLAIEDRRVYRRFKRLLGRLRSQLEYDGLRCEDVVGAIGNAGFELPQMLVPERCHASTLG